jgi:hypothetical protein
MALDPALLSTLRVGELPPEIFSLTDKIPHEVGTDLKRGTIQDLVTFLLQYTATLQFQVIELDVTNQYIIDNFDETGLGKNICSGYAICNGINGTKNRNGLTSIGYGINYTAIGGNGGSKDAVLVEHSHNIKYASTGAGTKYPETPYIGDTIAGNMQGTESAGVSGTDKNMQPYIVTLMIQKI